MAVRYGFLNPGVLTETVVAASIPVLAATFPHAVEPLSDGRGLLVPHRNPAALATAIRTPKGALIPMTLPMHRPSTLLFLQEEVFGPIGR